MPYLGLTEIRGVEYTESLSFGKVAGPLNRPAGFLGGLGWSIAFSLQEYFRLHGNLLLPPPICKTFSQRIAHVPPSPYGLLWQLHRHVEIDISSALRGCE